MSSVGKSQSQQRQQATSEQFVAPFQVPFLESLFGQAAGVQAGQQGRIGGIANELGSRLGAAGQEFLGNLSGIAGGARSSAVGSAIEQLLGIGTSAPAQALAAGGGQLPGTAELQAIASGESGLAPSLAGPSPAIEGQLSALDAFLQENLRTTLGTISGQASQAGATGGSRQALVSGLAGQEAQRTFAGGAADILATDFARRQALAPQAQAQQLAAAQALQTGGVATAGQDVSSQQALLQAILGGAGGAGGLGGAEVGQQIGAGGTGLEQLGGLFNLGLAPFGAEFSPLQSLAQILGPAILLGSSESSGRGDSSSFSFAFPS